MPGIPLQRGFEPRERGDQPILGTHQLAAQDQRVGIPRIELDCLSRRADRARHVARGEAEAADIGPYARILGRDAPCLAKRGLRRPEVAARRERPRADAQPIGAVARVGRLAGLERALGIALEQLGMGAQRGYALRIIAKRDRAIERAIGRHALVEQQQRTREHRMGLAQRGVVAYRPKRLAARRGGVALAQIFGAFLQFGACGHRIGTRRHQRDKGIEQQAEHGAPAANHGYAAQRHSAARPAPRAGGHRPSSGHRAWGG